MSSSRIVVNQPTEPWDIILNNRFFEGMGCNALLLQKKLKTNLIEKLGFKEGEDFLYWNTLDELPTMIETVLSNYGRYTDIIESGNKKVKAYEMKLQMQKIVGLILDKFYDRL
jgi:spore maturation protein CgeB